MRALKPCGTHAAYKRHRLRGEQACTACRAANATYEAKRTQRPRLHGRGPLARFWDQVALPDGNGCMLWLGPTNTTGYGVTSVEGKSILAHRVSLLLSDGPPPDDLRTQAAHGCRNCHCVAPAHLRWASHAENMADKRRDDTEVVGARNGSAKLTEAQVSTIRQRYEAGGVTQRELARQYLVSQNTVFDLLRGRTWQHVSGAS